MKRTLLAILAICLLFTACKKDENPSKLDNSRKAWQAYKKSVGNSYKYTVYYNLTFGGYRETTIIVINGEVHERKFLYSAYKPNSSDLETKIQWSETGAAIGSHADSAADAITLDQVYVKAPSLINVNPDKNEIYFAVDSQGLIHTCGYTPKGCQDDCFNGLNIKDIGQLDVAVI